MRASGLQSRAWYRRLVAAYDLHQHLWPEPLLSALAARRDPPRLRGRVLELPTEAPCDVDLRAHRLDVRLAELDRHEIDVAVVSLPPTVGCEPHEELREAYHAGIAELVEAAGEHSSRAPEPASA